MVVCVRIVAPLLLGEPKCIRVLDGVATNVPFDEIEYNNVAYPVDEDGRCVLPTQTCHLWPLDHFYHPELLERISKHVANIKELHVAYDILMLHLFTYDTFVDHPFLQQSHGRRLVRQYARWHEEARREDFVNGVFVWSEEYFAECVRRGPKIVVV
jgi:hypothetical protein